MSDGSVRTVYELKQAMLDVFLIDRWVERHGMQSARNMAVGAQRYREMSGYQVSKTRFEEWRAAKGEGSHV